MNLNNCSTKHIKIKDLKQRENIEIMLKVNTPINIIAMHIGVGERTIRNEIKRGLVDQQDSMYGFKKKYSADYSQIELRVLAHMSQDEELIKAYKTAQDIHRITASQVFHIPFDEETADI